MSQLSMSTKRKRRTQRLRRLRKSRRSRQGRLEKTNRPKAASKDKQETSNPLCICGREVKYAGGHVCEECWVSFQVRWHGRSQRALIYYP